MSRRPARFDLGSKQLHEEDRAGARVSLVPIDRHVHLAQDILDRSLPGGR
jgi:hypothetical protein